MNGNNDPESSEKGKAAAAASSDNDGAIATPKAMPTTQPPGLFVSVLVSIAVLPIIGFLVVISIPTHTILVLWHVCSSSFTRKKLERLQQQNWVLPSHPLLEASAPILIVGSGIGGFWEPPSV